jgi:hypothetical protein
MYIVPRQALDIDYCDVNPAMVTDEYNTIVSYKCYLLFFSFFLFLFSFSFFFFLFFNPSISLITIEQLKPHF